MASGMGNRLSNVLLSWHLPSVIRINAGILPLRSNKVCTLTAAREYLPGAHPNSFRLSDIVVESNANPSFAISTPAMLSFLSLGRTLHIRSFPKLEKIRWTRPSFALDRVDWLTSFQIQR